MELKDTKPNSQGTKKFAMPKVFTYLSLLLLGSGISLAGSNLLSQSNLPSQATDKSVTSNIVAQLPFNSDQNFVTSVVQNVGPAVVRIDASRSVSSRMPRGMEEDPFFGQFYGGRGMPESPRSRQVSETGSGFIINSDGHILTNAHVVSGSDTVRVTLKDGRALTGKVLGADSVTDVAVIKVDTQNLPTVKLGNSDSLKPGEWAIAIGNPLGLDNTVTTGIVSATGRSSRQVGVPDQRVKFVQTDAAINPGNSGGPLLNASGEVIGINTAIIQGAQGIGFAIPVNTAKNIADKLISQGKVQHPYLGIQMVDLTPEIKQNINSDPELNLNVNEDDGVLVVRVMPNSPAEKAGLRSGDIISKVNNQSVEDSNAVQQAVDASSVGARLPMEVRRGGQNVDLVVQPGALPNRQQQQQE
ncbi:trypsin-like peptidase domain-containing protein [Phormidium sp. LEGE 05292]|uniref:HhoA/HhoB/HtrA family serine endopeptidase n=1 Tax=[Phormidium] sp. LEGE 05292 TaxID=767427 RepID=UPI001881B75D|nr:HhoA/HhoB/HtrA family serine endopeptidase [Phormidium sp. LEGE 05292]MBE9225079.1 trypsin-like peptidase domain-containing protein [Phormidium sp. LEGE 05292]